jgi:DNA repair protein RadC
MAASHTTRRASGARGGAYTRLPPADMPPLQLNWMPGLPHLDGDAATAVRRFAASTFPPYTSRADTVAACGTPAPYEDFTPVFYAHNGSEFRVASPLEILVHAQHLISRSFHRKGPLIDQPHLVRALLHVQLGAHLHSVFALVLLSKDLRLLDFVEVFNGTTDHVVVHTREVVRETLKRNAAAVIAARSDPTGEGKPTEADVAAARRIREVMMNLDIRLLDYLIVGNTIASLAERGVV